MRILVVSSYLPFPLYSGGQVRLYNLIKELSSKHEITLICEKRPTETADDIHEVEKICKEVLTVNRKKQWSIGNIIKAGASSNSFLVTGHTLPTMKDKIRELLSKKSFDIIHVETFYVMQNVPPTDIPIVLVEHNIEYNVYTKFKDNAPLPLRPLLAIDIAKIRKEEERFWKAATKVVAVSKDDQNVIQDFGVSASVVSNGVDTDTFALKDLEAEYTKKEKKILFIGDFKWLQNKDSATFIINEIWPALKVKCKTENVDGAIRLWFVARNIPDSIRNLTDDPDILFDEESSSKSTPEIFQEATILLAPIRVGGGTSYKILESMSCGTPVVTMPLSANALQATDRKELMVGNNAEELAQKTFHLLQDKVLYEGISKKGRVFIEKHYTWKEIAQRLNEVYSDAMKNVSK